jgi:protein-disulfide isomerase
VDWLLARSKLVVAVTVSAICLSTAGSAVAAHTRETARQHVLTELSGISQEGNVLGNPRAPVTMEWFGDLQCPICREFAVGALPSIIHKFVRTGKVKVEYRSFETATRERSVFDEQETAALGAGRQRLMWYFVQLFYREQGEEDSGYVTPAFLRGIAQQVPGLNVAQWETERSDPSLVQELQRDEAKANRERFAGDPSFLVGRTGRRLHGLTYFTAAQLHNASELFEPVLERVLKGRGIGKAR